MNRGFLPFPKTVELMTTAAEPFSDASANCDARTTALRSADRALHKPSGEAGELIPSGATSPLPLFVNLYLLGSGIGRPPSVIMR